MLRFFLLCLIFFSHSTFALSTIANMDVMKVQIIKFQLELNNDTIEKANVIVHEGIYKGLEVSLKPEAAKVFTQATGASINMPIQVLLNGAVVSLASLNSALSSDFLITGINQIAAEEFIKNLKTVDEQLHPKENNPMLNPIAQEPVIQN